MYFDHKVWVSHISAGPSQSHGQCPGSVRWTCSQPGKTSPGRKHQRSMLSFFFSGKCRVPFREYPGGSTLVVVPYIFCLYLKGTHIFFNSKCLIILSFQTVRTQKYKTACNNYIQIQYVVTLYLCNGPRKQRTVENMPKHMFWCCGSGDIGHCSALISSICMHPTQIQFCDHLRKVNLLSGPIWGAWALPFARKSYDFQFQQQTVEPATESNGSSNQNVL